MFARRARPSDSSSGPRPGLLIAISSQCCSALTLPPTADPRTHPSRRAGPLRQPSPLPM
jgi:hypothetical protein